MSQRRARIVGVQAAAVAVLVLVVYLTLLRPEDQGPLSGIEAPGGGPQAGIPAGPTGPNGPTGDRPGDGRGDGAPPSGGHGGTPGGGPLGLVLGSTATGVGGAPPPAVIGAGPNTPSDDQYKDSAQALLDKVAITE